MQRITWLGHGSWQMVTATGTTILVDPWIAENPVCPVTMDDITRADIVCVTHGHDDHLGDSIELVKKTGAVLVTLPELAIYCSRHGIPYDDRGGCLHTGGSVVQKDVRIYAVYALHHSDILGKEFAETKAVMPGSGACGMVIVPDRQPAVYFAGDTGIFGDMALIAKLYRPYVAVLPIGGKYTMGVREAAYAAELLGCKYVIPGHYNTFPGDKTDTDDLIRQVRVRAPATEVHVLTPGQVFEF